MIPVSSPFEDYGRNGISCRLVNKSTAWKRSMTKSVKSVNVSHYVVQRVSGSRFEVHTVYAPRGECRCPRLFSLPSDHSFREVISHLLNTVEPDEVKARRRRGFKRRRFWAAGVNDVWPQDQHDKWGRFGLWLHAGLEAFSGEINWMKIWWTNKNPRLIAKSYIDTCRRISGTSLCQILGVCLSAYDRCSNHNSKRSWHGKLWSC
jgi:hypothetical protein